jgi:hypothetical protein
MRYLRGVKQGGHMHEVRKSKTSFCTFGACARFIWGHRWLAENNLGRQIHAAIRDPIHCIDDRNDCLFGYRIYQRGMVRGT